MIFRTWPLLAPSLSAWCIGRLPTTFLSLAQSLSAASKATTTASLRPYSMHMCSGVIPVPRRDGAAPGMRWCSTRGVRANAGLALTMWLMILIAFFVRARVVSPRTPVPMVLMQWNSAVYPSLHGLSIPSGNASMMSATTLGSIWQPAARCKGSSFAPLLLGLATHFLNGSSHISLTTAAICASPFHRRCWPGWPPGLCPVVSNRMSRDKGVRPLESSSLSIAGRSSMSRLMTSSGFCAFFSSVACGSDRRGSPGLKGPA
mmetsp:Transcript_12436/g.57587  ORF Transcript_12436/g.57587 Transcript_12436/m.57587 type:complete len:260 (+) Transcript_12436:1434-2213(+)